MTTVTLGRGAIIVTDPPIGLKEKLTYWKRELTYDKARHLRAVKGHYENLYYEEGNKISTHPGFGHRILEYLRKTGTKYEIEDRRIPLPDPNFELACKGLRDYQLEPVIEMIMAGGGILSAATGFGKALPDNATIPTPAGVRRVGDIRTGDLLFGKDGFPVTVLGVHPQEGEKDIWEIEFGDGRIVECCEDHLWTWIYRLGSRLAWHTGSTKEIKENLEREKASNSRRYMHIPMCNVVQYQERDLPVHPYVLGALIGNGCLCEPDLTISSGDDFVPKKIAEILDSRMVKRCRNNYSYNFELNEKIEGKRGLHHIIKTYDIMKGSAVGLCDMKSGNKFIPYDFLTASAEQRLELLNGLMDTDGTVDEKGRTTYSTTSGNLACCMADLVRSLGGSARIVRENRNKYASGECFIVCISVRKELKLKIFSHPSKIKRVEKSMLIGNRKYSHELLRIVDVRKTDRKSRMTCFTVDAEDRLFLCENYTVTHNTVIASAIIRAFDPEQLKLRGTPTVVFSAPDKDINYKNWESLKALLPEREVGLVMSGHRKFSDDVQVITLDSLHLLNPDEVGILIVDEVHTSASETRMESISKFSNAARWGVSATPSGRFDGGDMVIEGLFGPVVCRRTYQDAVKLGALVPIEVYWVKAPPPKIGMDYYRHYKNRDPKIRAAIINNPTYSQLVADLIKSIPESKSVLCFTQWIAQMANIHAHCPEVGYVHAQTKDGVGTIKPITAKQRKDIYDKMASGEIRKMLATYCWKQGVDFPALDIVINASGGGSDIVAKQIPGRASRRSDGKDKAYVVDFIHEWDWDESDGSRKPGPMMASDLARKRSYRELGFEQHTVETISELPFIKETT